MRRKSRQYYRYYSVIVWITVFILALVGNITLNIAIARIQYPQPQAILTLGGSPQREIITAELTSKNPELIAWVSSGTDYQIASKIFHDAGVSTDRYFLDYNATDTVTNFTTLIPELKKNQIKHVYLITSEFHMPRAKSIGIIILSSHGIIFTPLVVDNTRYDFPEPKVKILRDIGRSIIWVFSGYTGANLKDLGNKQKDQ